MTIREARSFGGFDFAERERTKCLIVVHRVDHRLTPQQHRGPGMNFKHTIEPELTPLWLPVIERHFAMTVAPLTGSLKRPRVRFAALDEGDVVRYCCEISGATAAGASVSVRALHRDGRTAITDAFAQARREIVRRQRTAFSRLRQTDASGLSP